MQIKLKWSEIKRGDQFSFKMSYGLLATKTYKVKFVKIPIALSDRKNAFESYLILPKDKFLRAVMALSWSKREPALRNPVNVTIEKRERGIVKIIKFETVKK